MVKQNMGERKLHYDENKFLYASGSLPFASGAIDGDDAEYYNSLINTFIYYNYCQDM